MTYKKLLSALVGGVCIVAMATPVSAQTRTYNIPAGSLKSALDTYGRQSGRPIIYKADDVRQARSPGVRGDFLADVALNAILSGTGFIYRTDSSGAIAIMAGETRAGDAAADNESAEIVVTGSHIRGINQSSPIHTVSRKDIDSSGYSQIGDLVRSLPENFSGGQNPGVLNASGSNISNTNYSNASSVNFRGLGSDATLTLLNGHRLVNDSYFQSPDISGVPLAAVSRMEAVLDGASAIYGSDAVAGVMNVILNTRYNGLEASARIGGATQGGGFEQTYNILAGISGPNGHLMLSAEYSHQDEITASERDFTSAAYPDTSLLMGQRRKSLFLSAGTNLSSNISISLDALYSDRSTNGLFAYSNTVTTFDVDTPTYNMALNIDADLGGSWKATITGVAGGSKNKSNTYYPDYDYLSQGYYENKMKYVELSFDGTLLHVPAGEIKAAIGGGYRQESFQQSQKGNSSYIFGDRQIKYLFGELQIPFVSPSETRSALHELGVTISARMEDYNDFGSTTNPKVGLRYKPLTSLTVRATWGTSFKAPSFFQLYQPVYAYLDDAVARGGTSGGTSLEIAGGRTLKSEKAEFWTVGVDYAPDFLGSARFSATYFNTKFRDRIVRPIDSFSTALSDPSYAPFITRNPSDAEQAAVIASAYDFINYSSSAYDPTQVVAIIHSGWANASTQFIQGIDVSYNQDFSIGKTSLRPFANFSWLNIRQQTLPTVPERTLTGLVGFTPKFKARGGITLDQRGFSATAIINYISGETDFALKPEAQVSSWTTSDLTLSYRTGNGTGPLRGIRLALSVSNLFDRDPPYVESPGLRYAGLNYDAANHSAVGRFVSFTLAKSW